AVVAAVSRGGGLGMLGAARFDPDELDEQLEWIDADVVGRPYGVDVVLAASVEGGDAADRAQLIARIPDAHRAFVERLRERFSIPPLSEERRGREHLTGTHPRALSQLEVALAHPVCLLVSALGPLPRSVVEAAHSRGMLAGGMCGGVRQARAHVEAGADMV